MGNSFHFVFSSVKEASSFAFKLRDRICNVDWKAKGLPENVNLRIALHAGPVHYCKDPVLNKHTYHGTHVSRAARIEPITPPGQVYANQEFAALPSAQRIKDFSFDYVGQIPLPKKYGIIPLYHLKRKDD